MKKSGVTVPSGVAGGEQAGGGDPYYYYALRRGVDEVSVPEQWRGRPQRQGIYAFLRDLEARDAHLGGCLRTRRVAIAAAEMRVVDGGDDGRSREVGGFVRETLAAVGGLRTAIMQLLDAFGKGWALVEIMWRRDDDGRVRIDALVPRRQERFAFDARGGLWLLGREGVSPASAASAPSLLPHPGGSGLPLYTDGLRAMPERKFCTFVFEPSAVEPYGNPLSARAAWLCWYKRVNVAVWNDHNERFGAPMPIVRYSPGTTEREIARLKEILEKLRSEGGLLLDENVSYELVEPKETGSISASYRELTDWCNDEISKIVLGQTLTSSEGRRTGSEALGNVHERVLNTYHASDALALGDALTRQLSRWITDFNFGTDVPCPRVTFETRDPVEDEAELAIDEKLVRMGVPLSSAWFYTRYRRPAPTAAEHALCYDDQNLFQYHLHYGVLTINEVRQRLGLPPVPWGERRVTPLAEAPNPSAVGLSPEEQGASLETRNEEGAAGDGREAKER